ncbi:helix-turn-helix domain-containing protein [Mycobacterium intracellulare]|uniref:helix-turn-helix domain-containing protein n=1 Tax=Mycobacterium intracellulare TaxID=1767 RepID=UPI001915A3EE|nr:helix-turn-helix domain-containing protein [Mycobacterium intracellulare]
MSISANEPQNLLSTTQVAQKLGVSPNTVRNYVAQGLLTAHKVGPKLLKFDPAELERIAYKVDNRS